MTNKRQRDLVTAIERIGYAYDHTNASGLDFYVHEDTGYDLKVPTGVDESRARSVMVTAQRQIGLATKDNKRKPAAIRERNACEHARAAAELARIQAQRTTGTDDAHTRAIEDAYLRAERKFRYWDRLMRESCDGAA